MAASDHAITFRVDNPDANKVKNTWADWHIVPATRPLFLPPVPKYQFIDIPGADADLDFTEILGVGTVYNAREGSNEFIVMNGYGSWEMRYSEIMNYLHGKRMKVMLDDDPSYYYMGRVGVNEWRSEKDWSRIVLDYHMDPYKYERTSSTEDWLWDALNFETGVIRDYRNISVDVSKELTIPGTAKRVIPTFTVSNDSRVSTVSDASTTEITGYGDWTRFATTEHPSGLRQGWYYMADGRYDRGTEATASQHPKPWTSICTAQAITMNGCYSFTVTPPKGYNAWVSEFDSGGVWVATHGGTSLSTGVPVTVVVSTGNKYAVSFWDFYENGMSMAPVYAHEGDVWITYSWSKIVEGASGEIPELYPTGLRTGYWDPSTGDAWWVDASSHQDATDYSMSAILKQFDDSYSSMILTCGENSYGWITEYDSNQNYLRTYGTKYDSTYNWFVRHGYASSSQVTAEITAGHYYGFSFYGAPSAKVFPNLTVKVNPDNSNDFMKSFTLGLSEIAHSDQNNPILTATVANKDLIIEMLAVRCWNGKYGAGADRKVNIEDLGYSYDEVQAKVDEMSVYFGAWRYLSYDFYDLNARLKAAGINLDTTDGYAWLYCDVPTPTSAATPSSTPSTQDKIFDWSTLGTPTYPSGFQVGLYNINNGQRSEGGYGNYIMSATEATFPGYETLTVTPPAEYGVWISVFDENGNYVRRYGENGDNGIPVGISLTDGYSYGFTFYGFKPGDYSNAGNKELLSRFVAQLTVPVVLVTRKGLTVTLKDKIYFLPIGITKNPNIVIENEETVLKFTGSGSVTVEYRGGSL